MQYASVGCSLMTVYKTSCLNEWFFYKTLLVSFHLKANVVNKLLSSTYFYAMLNKATWVFILINLYKIEMRHCILMKVDRSIETAIGILLS